MADLIKISDAKIDQYKGDLRVTALDSKAVHFGILPKRWDLTDDFVAASVLPSSHNGIVVSFAALIPEFPPGVDRVHFDIVISSDSKAVSGNVINDSLVSSRRLSDEHSGFFVESDNVYYYPTAGLPSSYSGRMIHIVISNVDVDPYYPVMIYWRPRWYASDVLDSIGDFNGMQTYVVKSLAANTGTLSESNQLIELPTASMSWPVGKDASFEVYVGTSFRDSSVNHAGFRYYDGEDIVILPQGGIDGLMSGNSVYLMTNPIDITAPIVVRTRAKWDTGSTIWYSKIHFPEEKYTELTAYYYPQEIISIPHDTYVFDYNIQVITGTSPSLSDYFYDGNVNLDEPDTGSPYLHNYSDSGNSAHSGNFSILDGTYEIDSPSISVFDKESDTVVVYSSPLPFLSDSEMYILWRVRSAWESYEVLGAGTASANGIYCREGMYGSRSYYNKGSWYIFWDPAGGMWVIGTALGADDLNDVFYYVVSTSIHPPLLGWDGYFGILPDPTLSVISCDPLSLPSSSSSSGSSSSSSPSSSSSSVGPPP